MPNLDTDELTRISHNIKSLAKDMYTVKETLFEKKKEVDLLLNKKDKLAKKEEKRKQSLRKAQKKFKIVSTNLSIDSFKKLEIRLKELKINKSAYLTMLINDDLEKTSIIKNA